MESVKLKDILNVKTGKHDANHAVDKGTYHFFTCAIEPLRSNTFSFDDEVIILPGNGANVGEVLYHKGKLEAYQRTYILHEIKADVKYLFYYLKKYWIRQISRKQVGSATNYIKLDDILSFEIPLPDLATQQKIAAVLDKADELRQYNKQLIEKYDALTQSLFLDMFGDPVRNEKGFPKTTVRNLCEEVKYGTSAKSDGSGKWPYLRMNNITYSGYMDFSDVKSINVSEKDFVKYSVKKGDVLFNRTNSKELVGKTGIITNDDTYIIAGYLIRVRVNQVLANPYFLWAHLNSKWAKLTLSNMCKNIVGMANINAQELQDILILQPPVTLQNQFAERVQLIEQQKELAQQTLQKSEELFNSLLQKAFKGELVAEYEL
ncbi:restriction endonuclease subunit S [Flavobacterium sp. RHBU_3]|uniref:restriction endonuclease subunit S n=1 Tax=Flavobacterium sp. RHBU_3 TaxID=3391184 RepID=UPI003984BCB3